MATEKETVIIDFQVNEGDALVSIESLTKANKALREERNKLNLTTQEGVKRAQEINSLIDRNTTAIKNNSSALEKQRLNVGNYTESIKKAAGEIGNTASKLDALVPGLGAASTGFQGMVTTSKAFIATPIGAVIGALGLALGALMKYFKDTGEGQDKLTAITKSAGIVWEKLMRVVEGFGKAIGWVIDKLGLVSKEGQKLADLDDEIDQRETDLVTKRAETANKVAKIRARALEEEGEAKRKSIEEAIALERELADEEIALSKKRLQQFDEEHKTKKDLTDEEKRERAELSAAITSADTAAYQNTLRFEKEIEKFRDEASKAEAKRRQIELERQEADKQFIEEQSAKMAQAKLDAEAALAKAVDDNIAQQDAKAAADEKAIDNAYKLTMAIDEQNKETVNLTNSQKKELIGHKTLMETIKARMNVVQGFGAMLQMVGGNIKELAIAGIILEKVAAISQIISNTGEANAKAVATSPLTFGQPWVAVNTASAAFSIASVIAGASQALSEAGAAAGGGSFMTKGPQLLLVGDNPGGVERVDVTPVSGKGRTIVGKNMVQMAGGGTMYTDASTVANASNAQSSQMMQPKVILTYSEFREFANMVEYKDSIATA